MKNFPTILLLSVLLLSTSLRAQTGKAEESAVIDVLNRYAAAVESKDIDKIENYVVTTDAFTVFEGGHVNLGWADYRDHHLAPELKEFKEFQYRYTDIKPRVRGQMAYATLRYAIAVKMEKRDFSGKGLLTAVLVKDDGQWKITHIHTSRIPEKRKQAPKTDGNNE